MTPELGATDDSRSFAVFTRGPGVEAAPFGPQTATGLPGLGGQAARASPGHGHELPADRLRSDQILAADCLLSAVGQRGVKVSRGTLRLNGRTSFPIRA